MNSLQTPSPISADMYQLSPGHFIVGLIVYIVLVIAYWRIFTKAGVPGWLSIIPFVNMYFLVKIAGMNGWLFLLLIIPIVNVVFSVILAIKLGAAFGKGAVFSVVLLWLFSLIGYLILGFGSAEYRKSVAA
ncbi:DUF5684 domain-containing protein [Microbacterium sp. P01]|uniref:DUF5684 domain-containing protein n=1 Tax=unclassified Microbacterium TaxID=2609290 RepID=UPI00366E6306